MTIIREFRIVMPLSLEEYHIGQLYSVIETSKNTTGGGDGIEWLENRPFNDKSFMNETYTSGQYTKKVYHMDNKLPGYIKAFVSANSRAADEEAWNAFPFCRVEIKPRISPKFNIYVESMHIADGGTTENALNLSKEMLAKREVIHIDIVKDKVDPKDYKVEYDPTKFLSKTGRGQLTPDWKEQCEPVMCCYKLVHVECSWWAFSRTAESFIAKQYPRMFTIFHRQLFCTMDKWIGLTMTDIRRLEGEAMAALKKLLTEGTARGPTTIS